MSNRRLAGYRFLRRSLILMVQRKGDEAETHGLPLHS